MKMQSCRSYSLVVTCEHGGNRVPGAFCRLFRGRGRLLKSHRGYDAGALELAGVISLTFSSPLYSSDVTRLLVDLNRSPDSRSLFSEISGNCQPGEKAVITNSYYLPYRRAVERAVAALIAKGRPVIHLSVHTFTPEFRGRIRNADIGLLYDPARGREREFCGRWLRELVGISSGLRVRRNYPYLGRSDGFTTFLRRLYPDEAYLGIEIEINQRHLRRNEDWSRMKRAVIDSLKHLLLQEQILPDPYHKQWGHVKT